VQIEIYVKMYVEFDGLYSNFRKARQPNYLGNLISLFSVDKLVCPMLLLQVMNGT